MAQMMLHALNLSPGPSPTRRGEKWLPFPYREGGRGLGEFRVTSSEPLQKRIIFLESHYMRRSAACSVAGARPPDGCPGFRGFVTCSG